MCKQNQKKYVNFKHNLINIRYNAHNVSKKTWLPNIFYSKSLTGGVFCTVSL